MRSFLANFKKVLAQGGGDPLPDPPPSVAARPRMSPEFEQLLGWQHCIYIHTHTCTHTVRFNFRVNRTVFETEGV